MASVSGSTSGNSSSTNYTSSRGSALSSSELGVPLQFIGFEEKPKKLERAKHLAKEFCHGDGDTGALERWLSEMGVGWVLDLASDPSVGMPSLLRGQPHRDNLTERWIRALTEITESIHFMSLLEGRFLEEPDMPDPVQLVRFLEATIRKMLPFFDALLAAADLDTDRDHNTAGIGNGERVPSEKLRALLSVRDAVSRASEGIQLCFYWESSAEMEAQRSKLLSLLSAKDQRLDEAIWNTMEEVRTSILSDDNGDDNNEWSIIQTPEGSSSICNDTRSLMAYIKSLWNNYSRLDHTVCAAAELGSYVPNRDIISSFHLSAEQVKTDPFTALTLEMVSSLEVKLAKRSESFQDQSLKFLFLINNTHFIQQQLHPLCHMKFHTKVLTPKIEDYIKRYLQASWAPVMLSLKNDTTPGCFRSNLALPEFDSEFQKAYTAQMLWKVPDPELRTRLRKAIVEEVVPGLRGYLEDSNITSPGVTPQEMEKMLLELFEG
jgi:hypothetical protein